MTGRDRIKTKRGHLFLAALIALTLAILSWGALADEPGFGASARPASTGRLWNTVTCPITENLTAIEMLAPDDGWIVAEGGKILHWNGATWNEVTSPTDVDLHDLHMRSSDAGWAVGDDYTALRYDGANWIKVPVSEKDPFDSNDNFYCVYALADDDVWIGVSGEGDHLLHRGMTGWRAEAISGRGGSTIRDIIMFSETHGWAVGERSNRLKDGLWQDTEVTANAVSIDGVSFTSVWMGCRSDIKWWEASETGWYNAGSQVEPYTYVTGLSMTSEQEGWATQGDTPGYWYDAGAILYGAPNAEWIIEWQDEDHSLKDIDMLSPYNGWAVGEAGLILHFQADATQTLTPHPSPLPIDTPTATPTNASVASPTAEPTAQVTLTPAPCPGAMPIETGQQTMGYVSEEDEIDYYAIEVTEPGLTIGLQVEHDTITCAMSVYYGSCPSGVPPQDSASARHIDGKTVDHLFAGDALGIYYIAVGGGEHEFDPYNPYRLRVDLIPDKHEPDNCADRYRLYDGSNHLSYLSYLGDKDYYGIYADEPNGTLRVTLEHGTAELELRTYKDDCPEEGDPPQDAASARHIGVWDTDEPLGEEPAWYIIEVTGTDSQYSYAPYTLSVDVIPNDEDVRTLIVTNQARLYTEYSQEANAVISATHRLAEHGLVRGLVVDVDQDTEIAGAYAQWDTEPTSITRANNVANQIRYQLTALRGQYSHIEYIVIVGNDKIVPFYRVKDYVDQLEGRENRYVEGSQLKTAEPTGAALNGDYFLSDDFYACRVDTAFQERNIYLPIDAIGRLIETPDQIIHAINDYTVSTAKRVDAAFVTGSDFMQDGAGHVNTILNEDQIGVTQEIGTTWTGTTLADGLLDPLNTLSVLYTHAAHNKFVAPTETTCDAETIQELAATKLLTGTVMISPGCHAGLNVPNQETTTTILDLPEVLVDAGMCVIGNTGYGWGIRDYHALPEPAGGLASSADEAQGGLSEDLYARIALELTRGTRREIGPALVAAKWSYWGSQFLLDDYDAKVVQQTVLYGLPMREVTTPSGQLASQSLQNQPSLKPARLFQGEPQSIVKDMYIDAVPLYTEHGTYYASRDLGLLDTQMDVDKPILPRYVESLDRGPSVRGAVLVAGQYTEGNSFDPVIAQALTSDMAVEDEPTFEATGWYPEIPWRIQSGLGVDGDSNELVTCPGQYDSDSERYRTWSQLYIHVFESTLEDHGAPVIESCAMRYGTLVICGSDNQELAGVIVAYTNGDGVWDSVVLDAPADSASAQWTTRGTAQNPLSTSTEFIVQLVDRAGRVAVLTGVIPEESEVVGEAWLPMLMR